MNKFTIFEQFDYYYDAAILGNPQKRTLIKFDYYLDAANF